jgi:hypothetical protein
VVILPADTGIDSNAGSAAGGAAQQSATWKDVRRTVNLGDVGSLNGPGATSPAVFAFDGPAPAAVASGPNNSVQGGATNPPASNDSGGQYVLDLPPEPRLEVDGVFEAAQGFVSVQIPVGPMTQSVRVVLHPPLDAPAGQIPALGQIFLVDSAGLTLAQIDPGTTAAGTPPQDLTVAMLNAPEGGQLVVRVTTIPATQSVAGPQSSFTSQSNVPFVLDVQSQNQQTEESPAATATEPGWVGTFAVTYAPQSNQSTQSTHSVTSGDPATDVAVSGQTAEVPPAGMPVNDGSSDSDGYYVRMATGPLVSRSSGPLGPVLAASGTDLTPPVDRHERALLQEIPILDRETDPERFIHAIGEGRWAVAQSEEESAPADLGERYVTVIFGAGGFPIKVTSRSLRDRAGLAGLLAALPAPAEPPAPAGSPPASLAAIPALPLELTAQVSYPVDRRVYPDYLKAACGLVLGLGLTSGPLVSDLITSLRKKTSRWLPADKTGKTGR